MSSACEQVRVRLASPDAARRLGQALWMMAGQPLTDADLVWARGPLGTDGEVLLYRALEEAGCVGQPEGQLRTRELSRFMCYLVEGRADGLASSGIVWTFPENLLAVPGVSGDGYAKALQDAVASAERTLTIASPYLEARGLGLLEEAVVTALQRGVSVVLITHEADDLSSMSSAALRSLQSEARRQPGRLSVYTTSPEGVLLHLKIVVADGRRGLVGSANLTGKGLTNNVEAGVLVGADEASELCQVVDRIIATGLAKHVFSTR